MRTLRCGLLYETRTRLRTFLQKSSAVGGRLFQELCAFVCSLGVLRERVAQRDCDSRRQEILKIIVILCDRCALSVFPRKFFEKSFDVEISELFVTCSAHSRHDSRSRYG